MGTLKQKRAVEKLVENSRLGKSKYDALIAAGYSVATAIKPTQVTESEGFKEEAKPFVDKMVRLRDKLVAEMDVRKLDEVQFNDMTTAVDKLTKNIQLLSGGETERVGVSLSALFDETEE